MSLFEEETPIYMRSPSDGEGHRPTGPGLRSLVAALLVPLLLILTQQAAFVHELGHVAQQVQQTSSPDRQTTGRDFCEKCFVFAHLSGASPSAPLSVLLASSVDECPIARPTYESLAPSTVCRIRGPPVFL